MSNIIAYLDSNNLIIEKVRTRKTENDIERIPIEELIYNKRYKSKINITNKQDENRVILIKQIENTTRNNIDIEEIEAENTEDNINNIQKNNNSVILVFTNNNKIYYVCGEETKVYKNLVKVKQKVFNIRLGRRGVSLSIFAYILNKYNMEIGEQQICLTDTLYKTSKLKIYNEYSGLLKKILKNKIVTYKFKMRDLIRDESKINNNVHFKIKVNGVDVDYYIGKRNKKIKKNRMYYVPIKTLYNKNWAINIRRTSKGNLVLIKRFKEDIENTMKFKFLENKVVSYLFYMTGELLKSVRKKKVNLYYEKFSSKAEEGVYELCEKADHSKNYFIIDKNSIDYNRIEKSKFVVSKYSFKYYRLLYRANNLITTEAPMHINILRSNNKYLRKSIYKKQFIFLQHGIIFMKNLGKNSSFIKNREAEPDYMIVSSEKEKDVVTDMLNIEESRLLNTGIAIFSKIKYKHITSNSDDFVTIMLTWKPYEEYLYNFQESTYYKNTLKLLNLFLEYIPKDKIAIIPHPKVTKLMMKTDLKDTIYQGPISKILEKTKLLVTDYSSVCYNAFYQGAGVIFYQEDLELYEKENGELIPKDSEYIGERVFSIKQMENKLNECIKDNKIDMSKIRTEKHEKIYSTINEFSDGKNAERIYEKLKELNII